MRGVSLSGEKQGEKGDEGRGCDGFRREIRNCRHIENHNSCEWRQASGIPGAYRDRYLDRVTINTDPWKVALGIIRGPRGEVTYTYLYSPPSLLPLPWSFVFFPAKRYSESNYFRYLRDTGSLLLIRYNREAVLRPASSKGSLFSPLPIENLTRKNNFWVSKSKISNNTINIIQ